MVPIDQLEQTLVTEKSNLNQLIAMANQLEIQLAEQLKRPQQIKEQLAEIRDHYHASQLELNNLTSVVFDKQELVARQTQLNTQIQKLNAALMQLEQEKIVTPLREQQQSLRLDLLNLQRESSSNLVSSLDVFLSQQRKHKISAEQAELEQLKKDFEGKHPLVQQILKENIRYTQLLIQANSKQEKYIAQNRETDSQYKELEKDYQSAEQKINLAGLSPALGNLLRDQRRNLPLAKNYQSVFEQIKADIAFASLEQFQLEEVKKNLSDVEQTLQQLIAKYVAENKEDNEKQTVEKELRSVLLKQKKLVFKLSSVYMSFSRTLVDVDFSLQQLVSLGSKYNHYLDQRLLWVPSAPVIDQNYLIQTIDSLVWIIKSPYWQQTLIDLKNSVISQAVLTLLTLMLFSALYWFKPKIKANLLILLATCSNFYTDRFVNTFYALIYILLLVLPVPLLTLYLGLVLLINETSTAFSQSVANGLIAATVPLLLIQIFFFLFKPKGFVQSFFGWKTHSVELVYKQLKWIRFVVIPAVFLIAFFETNSYSVENASLGRLALIIVMFALTYFMHRIAHPMEGVAKEFYQKKQNTWAYRLRYLWYISFVLMPLIVIGFAVAGYYHSALELQSKLITLIRLIFFITLFYEIIIRWMVLALRQLAIINIKQKHEIQKQTDSKDQTDVIKPATENNALLDIPKINEQSKKLLNMTVTVVSLVGFWLIIKDILPAFSIFEKIVLWQHLSVIDGNETLQSITLINVFLCLFYLLLMLIFVKNFPGLIDLIFASRYSMSAGSRYALIHLMRYAVIVITFISMANELGGSWSQVQWLVAAVSVGLGFGLQEIFANMVSGIILLFERPIRVGDTVTVGDISGKVCRIQMRATTIIDWDQKELIVPNKTFITDKLVNWTLTDTVTRVVIPVGVSYDSDDELVIKLFKQVIKDSPLVLDDPEPSVYFLGFGDSSLDFDLRVYVRELGDRLPAIDDLHRRIRVAFKEHNIEIPFPQRDLHIRTTEQPFRVS